MIEVLKLALADAKRNERHNNVAETRYWLNQYKLIAEKAIAELESQEPVAWKVTPRYEDSDGYFDFTDSNETAKELERRGWSITSLYTHPPQRTEQEPVQVSPLEFVEMVMEKEDLIGKPIFWAKWPNKENT